MTDTCPEAARLWQQICTETREAMAKEPLLSEMFRHAVLDRTSLADALAYFIAARLSNLVVGRHQLYQMCFEAYSQPEVIAAVCADMTAVCERDPASQQVHIPFLYLKGFHALEAFRVGHYLWYKGRTEVARYLQSVISDVFAVDIHPAARIGRGIMLDHATGLVIGETAVVGDNVSILQDVTLGGTGKETGDRHPKVGSYVMIGAGAKILGNIRIGDGSKIGACSVVLHDVPSHVTVVGIPARVVGPTRELAPAFDMDQSLEVKSVCTQGSVSAVIQKIDV